MTRAFIIISAGHVGNMNTLEKINTFFLSLLGRAPTIEATEQLTTKNIQLPSIKKRGYEAAAYGRRTSRWDESRLSPTFEVAVARETLAARSRAFVRNNPKAKKAISIIANKTIGRGIRPAFTFLTGTEKSKTSKTKKVKVAWNDWADNVNCDLEGNLNLYGLQRLVMRSVAESGECLVLKYFKKDSNGEMILKLRVLESDLIDTTQTSASIINKDGDYDYCGIRFSSDGIPQGVYIRNFSPDYMSWTESKYVSYQDCHLVYLKERPTQFRGVPFGSSSFIRMKDLDDFEDAQLIRQKIAACFTAFVTTPEPKGLDIDITNCSTDPSNVSYLSERVTPGMIETLNAGEDVKFGNPPDVDGYDGYVREHTRAIASGFGVSYEALSGDYSQVNFSSGRLSRIDESISYIAWQNDIMAPLMCKIFSWFDEWQVLKGLYTFGAVRCEWTFPAPEMVDPVRETNALLAKLGAGLLTYSEALRQLGYDPDDTMQELKEDMDKIDSLNLTLSFDARTKINTQVSNVSSDSTVRTQSRIIEKIIQGYEEDNNDSDNGDNN